MERREHANRERKASDLVGLFRSMNLTAAQVAGLDEAQQTIAVQIKIGPGGVAIPSGRVAEVPSAETWGMVVAEMLRAEDA